MSVERLNIGCNVIEESIDEISIDDIPMIAERLVRLIHSEVESEETKDDFAVLSLVMMGVPDEEVANLVGWSMGRIETMLSRYVEAIAEDSVSSEPVKSPELVEPLKLARRPRSAPLEEPRQVRHKTTTAVGEVEVFGSSLASPTNGPQKIHHSPAEDNNATFTSVLPSLYGDLWVQDARCAGVGDPDAFFPEKGGSNNTAKKICTLCAVRDKCLADALAKGELGIWGGLSERERRQLQPRAVKD